MQKLQEEAKKQYKKDARNKQWQEAEVTADVEVRIEENGLLLSSDFERIRSSDSRKGGYVQ